MTTVRYARPKRNFERVLRVKDLDRLGILHAGQPLVWNDANGFQIEMSDEMSDSLVEKLPTEFIVFKPRQKDEIHLDASASDESASADSVGSADASVDDEDDDDESSADDVDPDE